jgi:hypothetical protein
MDIRNTFCRFLVSCDLDLPFQDTCRAREFILFETFKRFAIIVVFLDVLFIVHARRLFQFVSVFLQLSTGVVLDLFFQLYYFYVGILDFLF